MNLGDKGPRVYRGSRFGYARTKGQLPGSLVAIKEGNLFIIQSERKKNGERRAPPDKSPRKDIMRQQ